MDIRPELQAEAQVFYGAEEAARYTSTAYGIQAELTRRSLHLAGLLPWRTPQLLLDVGCGSGLSGEVCGQEGYPWIGVDISRDMLGVAVQALSSNPAKLHCGGLVLADMAQGLPFTGRDGNQPLFDAAISISAVQWLLFRPDWWAATTRFFKALKRLLVPGAPAVLQVYVVREHEVIKLCHAAMAAGFRSGTCLPHTTTVSATAGNVRAAANDEYPSAQSHIHLATTSSSQGHGCDAPALLASPTNSDTPSIITNTGSLVAGMSTTTRPQPSSSSPQSLPSAADGRCKAGPQGGGCCHVVIDFPHQNNARKVSMILRRPQDCAPTCNTPGDGTATKPTQPIASHPLAGCGQGVAAPGAGMSMDACCRQTAPECPLAWHVGGTCSVWWMQQLRQHKQQHTQPGVTPPQPAQAGQQDAHHAGESTEGSDSPESYCLAQHHVHSRKLVRMLQRAMVLAPAEPGLLSPYPKDDLSLPSALEAAPIPGGRRPGPRTQHQRRPRRSRVDRKSQPPWTSEDQHPVSAVNAGAEGEESDEQLVQRTADNKHTGLSRGHLSNLAAATEDFRHLPIAIQHWQGLHTNCSQGVRSAVRITAMVSAPHLFPCGGHTCVTVLVRQSQSCGWLSDVSGAAQLMASLCGVSRVQVHGTKIENIPADPDSSATSPHETSKPDRAEPKPKAAKRTSDAFLGARVSYHYEHACPPDTHQLVFTGSLQTPGPMPPYSVLDASWCQPPCPVSQESCETVLTPAATLLHAAAGVPMHAAQCPPMQGTFPEFMSAWKHHKVGGKPATLRGVGGQPGVGMAVVAVAVEVVECACPQTIGGLCCRMLAALYDTNSSYNVPSVLAARLQERFPAPEQGSGSDGSEGTKVVPAERDTVGERVVDAAPAANMQRLALEALRVRLACLNSG